MQNDSFVMRPIYTRLDDETLERIDKLIHEKKYDDRASFIRRAAIEKIERETKILS